MPILTAADQYAKRQLRRWADALEDEGLCVKLEMTLLGLLVTGRNQDRLLAKKFLRDRGVILDES